MPNLNGNATYDVHQMRLLFRVQLGIDLSQSSLSRAINKGWMRCTRVGRNTVFTAEDAEYNLKWLAANWDAGAERGRGAITKRRQKYQRNRMNSLDDA